MSIQFRQALAYPFLETNRKAMIWLPGAFAYGLFFVGLFMGIITALMGGDPSDLSAEENFANPVALLINVFFQLVQLALQIGSSVLGLGYLWWLAARLQRDGLNTPGPGWFEGFPKLVLDGLKAFLYYIVISIPLFIPIVVFIVVLVLLLAAVFGLGFEGSNSVAGIVGIFLLVLLGLLVWMAGSIVLGPFLVAPLLRSAQSRDLGALFNLAKAWRWARQEYRPALTGMLYVILLFLVYGIGMVALMLTLVGLLFLPFLMLAPYASMTHLLVQAMPLPEEPGNPLPAPPVNSTPTEPQ